MNYALRIIKPIHSAFNAFHYKSLNSLIGDFGAFGDGGDVVVAPFAEHKIHLSAAWKIVANAKTQTRIILSAKMFSDTFETIVSSLRTLATHPDSAKRQREVVNDDEYILQRNILLLHPIIDSPARKVHISSRLDKHQLSATALRLSHRRETSNIKNSARLLRKGVEHHKTNIVSRILVLGTNVAKSNNKIFHNKYVFKNQAITPYYFFFFFLSSSSPLATALDALVGTTRQMRAS